MKKDIIFSVVLHLLVIAATVVSMPFGSGKRINPEDVIKVTIRASAPGKPAPVITNPAPTITAPQQVVKPSAKPADKSKAVPTAKTKKAQKPKPKKSGVRPGEEASALAQEYEEKEIETEATGAGSPFAGATIDNLNFDYPYWFEQAFNKIASNWRNPVDAQGTIICVVSFQVLRSGRVMEVEVQQMSGSDLFDESCVNAVERSNPFPPLPHEFAEDIIGITVPFKYEPR
ncbi:MAG: TonB family protein [candidate division Zixibacteria bacterium]|nr:TonB family protein [candidate division Zixibacteria bacterium]